MNIFTFIKSRISIMDVIHEYVTLKKAGMYWKGRCPFHHERTGSFTVSPHREIFYCFGCHKGGDLIAFIGEAEHISPLEAAQHLAERFSLEIPQELIASKTEASGKDLHRYSILCTRVAVWLHQELLKHQEPLAYLEARSIKKSTIAHFTMGYFPESRLQSLCDFVKKDGYLAQELIHAHILAEGKFGLYSPFAERIIFPIKDHLGRIVGFGGRIFKHDDNRAKYYNSQDHVYFSKGHILFGLDSAKKAIQEQHSLFLVEGYFDCIAMVQAGYTNTVATLGTACTLDHLKIVSRYAQRLNIVYDGDAAGQAAMLKLTQISWSLNMELFITQLPSQEDPASYLQKHGVLDDVLKNMQDIFHFFIQHQGTGYHNKPLQERVLLISEFMEIITMLDDPLKQNLLLQKAAATFDIPYAVLLQNLKNTKKPKASALEATSIPQIAPTTITEQKIITSLINSNFKITPEDQDILKKNCNQPICSLVEKLLLYNIGKAEPFHLATFIEGLEPHERELITRLVLIGEESQKIELPDLLQTLWKKEWKMIASDVKMRLKQAEVAGDQKTMLSLSGEFGELKKKMRDKGIL